MVTTNANIVLVGLSVVVSGVVYMISHTVLTA